MQDKKRKMSQPKWMLAAKSKLNLNRDSCENYSEDNRVNTENNVVENVKISNIRKKYVSNDKYLDRVKTESNSIDKNPIPRKFNNKTLPAEKIQYLSNNDLLY